jgi:transcriptional/translational regulatory protein YebC/TACO1
VITAPDDLHSVSTALEGQKLQILEANHDRIPKTTKVLSENEAERFLKFYEAIEEQDDVQRVFANFEIPDAVMEKLGS